MARRSPRGPTLSATRIAQYYFRLLSAETHAARSRTLPETVIAVTAVPIYLRSRGARPVVVGPRYGRVRAQWRQNDRSERRIGNNRNGILYGPEHGGHERTGLARQRRNRSISTAKRIRNSRIIYDGARDWETRNRLRRPNRRPIARVCLQCRRRSFNPSAWPAEPVFVFRTRARIRIM